MAVGPSPFETEFQNILPESGDNLHLRAAKVERRVLTLEATPPGSVTGAQVIAALGYTPQPSLGYVPENVANKDTDGTLAANSDTKYPSQKAVKTYADTKQAALGFTPENIANKDIDGTLAANSDTKYASQKAVRTFVLANAGASPPFADTQTIIKGSADATKLLRIEVDGFTAGTTRVLTPPNANATIAGLEIANVFTVKQTITPAVNTEGLVVSGLSLTVANKQSFLDLSGTWNTTGDPVAIKLNVTNTASDANSRLLDLQVNSSSVFFIYKTGAVVAAGGQVVINDIGELSVGVNILFPDGSASFASGGAGIGTLGEITGQSLGINGPAGLGNTDVVSLNVSTGAIVLAADGSAQFGFGSLQVDALGQFTTSLFSAAGAWQLVSDGSAQFALLGITVGITALGDLTWGPGAGSVLGADGSLTIQGSGAFIADTGAANFGNAQLAWNSNGQFTTDLFDAAGVWSISSTGVFTNRLAMTAPQANLSAITISGLSTTGSGVVPFVNLLGTWNTSGSPTAFFLDVTNTASGAASLLLDLRLTNATKFSIGKAGGPGFFGATAATTQQTSGANLTNNVTVGGTNDTIADFTSLTVYATDASAIRNNIYQLARKLKQVNDAMRLYGLLT